MKKGIVALLIGLAVLILVSPGLIGRLAERSVIPRDHWLFGRVVDGEFVPLGRRGAAGEPDVGAGGASAAATDRRSSSRRAEYE